MKSIKYLSLTTALLIAGALRVHAGNAVYISDTTSQPWGVGDFITAMNDDFGAAWTADTFGAAGTSVFNASNSFIFIEGGDGTSTDFNNYFQTAGVITAAQNWVTAGGSIFINGGRWDQPSLNVGFGVTMFQDFSNTGSQATASPIFTPATGSSWTGGYFSHDSVSGTGLTALITAQDSSMNLAQESYGAGHVIVGGITAPSFWGQGSADQTLLNNIILDGSQAAGGPAGVSDASSSLWLFAAALGALAFVGRRGRALVA